MPAWSTRGRLGAGDRGLDWFGFVKDYFQARTGMRALDIGVAAEDDFSWFNVAEATHGAVAAGGGAFAFNPNALSTGVLDLTGAAGGYALWQTGGALGFKALREVQANRWALFARLAVAAAPAANSSVVAYVSGNAKSVGVGFNGADTTWKYARYSAGWTDVADTGEPIVVNKFLTVMVANLNLHDVTVNASIDTLGVDGELNGGLITDIDNFPGSGVVIAGGGGAVDAVHLDAVALYGER
jgi:hypothetical protein